MEGGERGGEERLEEDCGGKACGEEKSSLGAGQGW